MNLIMAFQFFNICFILELLGCIDMTILLLYTFLFLVPLEAQLHQWPWLMG